ncbi:hypothetical protein CesoFtcFv8_010820 [Champsocephalus esox]|uniref:Uncharacterized protein n=1 Tax=Champsocephalus esox TaxID=159716 RepID=A0AAN8GXF2_9TELE|nr:hypothetical protein CesoFtcFv8_010820 [Champsocephalus esox]
MSDVAAAVYVHLDNTLHQAFRNTAAFHMISSTGAAMKQSVRGSHVTPAAAPYARPHAPRVQTLCTLW